MKLQSSFTQFHFKINLLVIFVCVCIFSCGPSEKEKIEMAEKIRTDRVNAVNDSLEIIKKKNQIRFETYLKKMQGTWIFQQTQNCSRINNRYLPNYDVANGICLKMKITISGSSYKAYFLHLAVKDGIIINDISIETVTPAIGEICGGGIQFYDYPHNQAMRPKILDTESSQNFATLICDNIAYLNTQVCKPLGMDIDNETNILFWDDTKEALHWTYTPRRAEYEGCQFSGYCEHQKE